MKQILTIQLIRHGATAGNRQGRYIGVTDEELSREGIEEVSEFTYPVPAKLYTSPMRRCQETAEILFPGLPQKIIPGLRECDFGEFENKNYKELEDHPQYQQWVDSFCEGPIPGGESKAVFQKRTLQAFAEVVTDCIQNEIPDAAIVAHGGTIMAVLDAMAQDHKSYYDWHVKNGHGYQVMLDKDDWKKGKRQLKVTCMI